MRIDDLIFINIPKDNTITEYLKLLSYSQILITLNIETIIGKMCNFKVTYDIRYLDDTCEKQRILICAI